MLGSLLLCGYRRFKGRAIRKLPLNLDLGSKKCGRPGRAIMALPGVFLAPEDGKGNKADHSPGRSHATARQGHTHPLQPG